MDSNNLNNYGLLLNESDIKLHRIWFKQMAQLLGIKVKYFQPIVGKDFNTQGDIEAKYYPPKEVYGILTEYPDQKTLKKMGWVSELQENSSILHVPYDLPGLEVGALFTLPSGIDNTHGRNFRVVSMQVTMIYPASIACEIAPEYESTTQVNEIHDFRHENLTVLVDNEDDD